MTTFHISIGSNIDPKNNIAKCLERLNAHFENVACSSIYETSPVGVVRGGNFWNLVVTVKGTFSRESLIKILKEIERGLDRTRDPEDKYAPRTIDLDVLPQKDYQKLAFIMIPLAELAPQEKDPETGKTFIALAEAIDLSDQNVIKISEKVFVK